LATLREQRSSLKKSQRFQVLETTLMTIRPLERMDKHSLSLEKPKRNITKILVQVLMMERLRLPSPLIQLTRLVQSKESQLSLLTAKKENSFLVQACMTSNQSKELLIPSPRKKDQVMVLSVQDLVPMMRRTVS
jgi:hypothetical protein